MMFQSWQNRKYIIWKEISSVWNVIQQLLMKKSKLLVLPQIRIQILIALLKHAKQVTTIIVQICVLLLICILIVLDNLFLNVQVIKVLWLIWHSAKVNLVYLKVQPMQLNRVKIIYYIWMVGELVVRKLLMVQHFLTVINKFKDSKVFLNMISLMLIIWLNH